MIKQTSRVYRECVVRGSENGLGINPRFFAKSVKVCVGLNRAHQFIKLGKQWLAGWHGLGGTPTWPCYVRDFVLTLRESMPPYKLNAKN